MTRSRYFLRSVRLLILESSSENLFLQKKELKVIVFRVFDNILSEYYPKSGKNELENSQ